MGSYFLFRHHYGCYIKLKQYMLGIVWAFAFLASAAAVQVQMTISTNATGVRQLASYTIFINRAKSATGTTITPTTAPNPLLIQITFHDSYGATNAQVDTYPYSIGENGIEITLNTSLYPSNQITLQIHKIINPIGSGNAFSIYAQLTDESDTLIDQAQSSLSFSPLDLVSQSYSFDPSSVSTLSTMTITLTMAVWETGMSIKLDFPKYWLYSMRNTSSNAIFSDSSSCTPEVCGIIGRPTSTVVVLTPTSDPNPTITLQIIDINTPPTLEAADTISISSVQATYDSIVESTSINVGAATPNSLKQISPTTSNLVNQPITLECSFQSQNIFGPNDTITLQLGIQMLNTVNITFSSALVSGSSVEVQTSTQIKVSSIVLITSTYNTLPATIIIQGLSPTPSTKTITGNTITLARNGFVYNQEDFSFAVSMGTLTPSISLSNSFANSEATATVTITFSNTISSGDSVYLSIPSSITVVSCSTLCTDCQCTFTSPNQTNPNYEVQLWGFSEQMESVSTSMEVKNPISSNEVIQVCSKDSENYNKQCGNVEYPQMEEATLESSIITVTMSNSTVYAINTYTLVYNFSSYHLQDGFLVVSFPSDVQVVEEALCTVNGQVGCTIHSSSPLKVNVSLSPNTDIYTIMIENIRNPSSTQPFTLSTSVTNAEGISYYSIPSQYYSASLPYPLTQYTLTQTNCENSALNTLSIQIAGIPFSLSEGIVQVRAEGQTEVQEVSWASPIEVEVRNPHSFQPITYHLQVKTSNSLYSIYSLSVTRSNCQPSYLTLNSFDMSGLPEDEGTLMFTFNLIHQATHVQILFPDEYPTNLSIQADTTIAKLSPRLFQLQLPSQQPVSISLSSYTNVLVSSQFTLSLYDSEYLVSVNNDTIKYQLSSQTSCIFSCKHCVDDECLSCYSSQLTHKYLFYAGQCLSECPASTYEQNQQCVQCPLVCAQCSSQSDCSSCSQFYYLFDNYCVTDCPDTTYPVDTDRKCQKCDHPCNNCVNSTMCISCAEGYDYLSGECLDSCPAGYVGIQGQCDKCVLPCVQCSTVTTNCTACAEGFYLLDFTCVSLCGGLLIGVDGVCVECEGSCESCSGTTSTCTSCISPLLLAQASCVTGCSVGYYRSEGVCLNCPLQCEGCSDFDTCSRCTSGYILNENSCTSTCPPKMFISTQNSIQQCENCSSGCFTCASSTVCDACEAGLYLVEGVCLDECPSSMFPFAQTCAACSTGCNACTSDTQCNSCDVGYSLYDGDCVWECPDNSTESDGICRACEDILSNCQECSASGCILCVSQYYVDDGVCVSACPLGKVQASNECVDCQVGCETCSASPDNCTSCQANYHLHENECVSSCPSPMISINSQCVSCSSPCKTCQSNVNNCTTCISSYYFLSNKCYSACPTTYYADSTKECVKCEEGCRSCSSQGCTQCESEYLEREVDGLYECYETCPSHFPYVVEGACSKCAHYCNQCSAEQCLQCGNELLRYGEFCVKECPPPLVDSSGSCTTDPTEPPQPEPPEEPEPINVPLPFTIILCALFLCCAASRLQHPATIIMMALLASSSLMAAIANIFTLSVVQETALYILFAGVGINYLSNILHSIFSFATFRGDTSFKIWSAKHKCGNWTIFFITLVTEHLFFVLYFSRIFNFPVFRSAVSDVNSLSCLNYFWVLAIFSNLLAIISGILTIAASNTDSIETILYGTDIIVVNLLVCIFGLALVKKNRELWQVDPDSLEEGLSSKKVIFDSDSHQNVFDLDVESMEEVNGKLMRKPNAVQNQYQPHQDSRKFNANSDLYFQQDTEKRNDDEEDGQRNENGSQTTNPIKATESANMKFSEEEMKHDLQQKEQNNQLLSDENRNIPPEMLKQENPANNEGLSNIFSPTKSVESKGTQSNQFSPQSKSVKGLKKEQIKRNKSPSKNLLANQKQIKQKSQKLLRPSINFDEGSKSPEKRQKSKSPNRISPKKSGIKDKYASNEAIIEQNEEINSQNKNGKNSQKKLLSSMSKRKMKSKDLGFWQDDEKDGGQFSEEQKARSSLFIEKSLDYLKESPRIAPYVFDNAHKPKKEESSENLEQIGENKEKKETIFNTLKEQIPLENSKINQFEKIKEENTVSNRVRSSIKSRQAKTFRSKNVSLEHTSPIDLKPTGESKKINLQSLIKTIQHKQRVRSQKEELKHIYMKK